MWTKGLLCWHFSCFDNLSAHSRIKTVLPFEWIIFGTSALRECSILFLKKAFHCNFLWNAITVIVLWLYIMKVLYCAFLDYSFILLECSLLPHWNLKKFLVDWLSISHSWGSTTTLFFGGGGVIHVLLISDPSHWIIISKLLWIYMYFAYA